MVDEKHIYIPCEYPPIPTYEEATSSRSGGLGYIPGGDTEEAGDNAERHGLLGGQMTRMAENADVRNSRRRYRRPRPDDRYHRARAQSDDEYRHGGSDVTRLRGIATNTAGGGGEESRLDGSERDSNNEYDGSNDEDEEPARVGLLEEMEVLDPEFASASLTGDGRGGIFSLSKHFPSLTYSLSSLHLDSFTFRIPWPKFTSISSWRPARISNYKVSWPVIARIFGLLALLTLIYTLLVVRILPNRGGPIDSYDQETIRTIAQSSINKDRIREDLKYITSFDHVAGTKGCLFLGKWIEDNFKKSAMDDTAILEYNVYMNYPKDGGRRIAIVDPPEMAWEALLEENQVYDTSSNERKQTLTYHGMSKTGNVTGPLIYANYGSKHDFKKLADSNVDVEGSVVLVRNYGTQPDNAMKVKAAEIAGAVGCIIYSDPQDGGFLKEDPWPDGPRMPSDGVQRSSVALTNWVIGDVLTPGWASNPDVKRLDIENNPGLVNIPSMPVAWRDAQKLLQALKGHGMKLKKNDGWIGSVPEVEEWWTGDNSSPIVDLRNEQDEVKEERIYNVLGMFEGIETQKKKIFVGNHRDSWCFGAADPGSGTAVMLEVIRILGSLRAKGWRPLRSIYFASWDAEEYNLIGSTEYVEDHLSELRRDAVAYINVDVGVSGPKFRAAGSPLMQHALMRVLDRVGDLNHNETLYSLWTKRQSKLELLGAGGDYVAFQDIAGCASIDVSFEGDKGNIPYHSCYETFEWMDKFGDPGFNYHKALAEVWVLFILEFAQEPILPFDFKAYSEAIKSYVDDLESYVKDKMEEKMGSRSVTTKGYKRKEKFDLHPLRKAAEQFKKEAREFDKWSDDWYGKVFGHGGIESNALVAHRHSHNARMSNFDTHLLDLPDLGTGGGDWAARVTEEGYGIPGREQYKHILYGPEKWPSSQQGGISFPAIRDAIDDENWSTAQDQVRKAANIISKASHKLLH